MCRQNQLWGYMSIAFGLGILVGTWLEGGFWCHCLGIGLLIVGCSIVRRK